MKFTTAISTIALALLPIVSALTLSYDTTYDNTEASLSTVSCSDGLNGLLTKGYTTFGSLPNLPNIGGAAAVAGWNSPQCGSCWNVTFSTTGKSVKVLAIDHAAAGFNVALSTMNTLTNGQGLALGRIDVAATQVPASQCGL